MQPTPARQHAWAAFTHAWPHNSIFNYPQRFGLYLWPLINHQCLIRHADLGVRYVRVLQIVKWLGPFRIKTWLLSAVFYIITEASTLIPNLSIYLYILHKNWTHLIALALKNHFLVSLETTLCPCTWNYMQLFPSLSRDILSSVE